jgi:hypothetical protein
MKSNRQVLWGAGALAVPVLCRAEPPAGAYVAFFVLPVVVAWVAIYVGFAVRGDIYRRIVLAILSIPITSLCYFVFGAIDGAMGWGDSMLLPIIEGLVVGFIPVLIFSKRTDRKPDGAP